VSRSAKSPTGRGAGRNRLRIIGGLHRRRQIRFPDRPGLRPTPDRVRETLFNWLSPVIRGAHCLDLFAGSGALGIEALSRGAARVDFVEKDRLALRLLRANLVDLGYADQPVHACDARWLLDRAPWQQQGQIDIVFIDPPFAALGLDAEVLAKLAPAKWLSPEALIYLEYPTSRPAPILPVGWVIRREGRAGESGYQLVARG